MAGKYDHILATLPRFLGEEPAYQEKINAVKRKILEEEPRQGAHFATQYAIVRREKDDAKDRLSEIQLRLTAYEQLLADQFENEGTRSLTLQDGANIRVQPEPYMVVQDKETFRQWCIENGHEREMHLMWQTANGILKTRLLEGEAEPEGTKAYMRTKIVFSGGR